MHWAYSLAKKLIEKHPNEVITCASGVSPSGYIHVGNFREIATTYFVTQALSDLGGKPRFILSWDDYDRLRKIPLNVTGVAETEIGKPYTKVAGPADAMDGESYATFFEKMFVADLARLGIQPEFIYETEQYESGDYDEQLKLILGKRTEIYDILARFRTETPTEAEREKYYPVSLYCDVCGHDSTTIINYDTTSGTITYTCANGHKGTQVIGFGQKIKLHWKIDWPMRWCYEKVAFEPGGKDHSSKNGSFDVATAVVQEIFGGTSPLYEPYDFVNIKGQTKKMSSSSGNIITVQELLKIYTPEMIFYLYAKYLPKAQFDLGLDDDVLRNYAEFERKLAGVKARTEKDETMKQIIKLTGVDLTADYPTFGHVVNILSLTGNDQEIAANLLQKEKAYSEAELEHILPRAAYWIENDAQQRLIKVLDKKNQASYAALTLGVKKEVKQLQELLVEQPELQGQALMQAVYDLTPTTDKAEKRQQQKSLFKAVYQLTLGQESGPRIPLLVEVVGREKMIELLSF